MSIQNLSVILVVLPDADIETIYLLPKLKNFTEVTLFLFQLLQRAFITMGRDTNFFFVLKKALNADNKVGCKTRGLNGT